MEFDIILYTHTSYCDLWPMYFGQLEKYFPDINKIIFVNEGHPDIPENHRVILYDDRFTYHERVSNCLNQIDSKYVIFQHEDMILYDQPDRPRLMEYLKRLEDELTKSYVKFIRGGLQVGVSDNKFEELKKTDTSFDYIFAIQPSFWKLEKLKTIYELGKGDNIWNFEIDSQRVCRENNIYGYYVDDGGIQRGKYHWDSNCYPYIATAVVKGKFNSEYKSELNKLFKEYNIDPKHRGWN